METEEKKDAPQKRAANVKEEAEEDVTGHTCEVCGRSFPLLSSLSQHMRRHTREKPYKCPYCEHRTAQKGTLKAHIRSHKLGLLTLNTAIEKEPGSEEQRSESTTPEPADKSHTVNGKVKKKETKKKVNVKKGDAEAFSCSLCSQVFPQAVLLKSHMKRHRNSQDHGCRICGRRFRQAWFLQSHMRIHRIKTELSEQNSELPATINGVPQNPASLINDECLYELCAGCGNFFFDRKTLKTHEKLHKLSNSRTLRQNAPQSNQQASEPEISQAHFMEGLDLMCVGVKDTSEVKSPSSRIPELDPICSYQAWQLATRGRLAEATEKCLGWEERLADAEVAYNKDKGEYVTMKQERKRKQVDTSGANVKKKKKGETVLDQTSNSLSSTNSSEKKTLHKDRILFNGLGHAFYEALHNKAKQANTFRSHDQEDQKPYLCDHCDFHTFDTSILRSHQHRHHQDVLASHSRHSAVDTINQSSSSKYMDYLRSRSVLLSQPYWNPVTCQLGQAPAEMYIKTEKPAGVKGQGQSPEDGGNLLNLSALTVQEGTAHRPVKTEGLVTHQCPYCSHRSTYPEVLWIHQCVAHKVDGSSFMAPKWAPCSSYYKSQKAGVSQWRRTGPPPFLEGKDCPAPGTQRPQSQSTSTPQSSTCSVRQSQSKTQSGVSKSKHSSKDSSEGTCAGGRGGVPPQKKSSGHHRAGEAGDKSTSTPATSSRSIVQNKNASVFQPPSSSKHRGHRAAAEGNFPQEGLGFVLARSHSGTSSNTACRQSCDASPGLKGPELWPAMNMWRLHGSKAYVDPLLFAQGKSESAGELPVNVDIFSLLKNYSPHDLALLYQHWAFIDPRIDPQAMLQLNGGFGGEVHSSSEAPKQTNSR